MVKEIAYAKVNLFLDVLGKREDRYHNLESVMAPIGIYDVLKISKRKDDKIQIHADVKMTEQLEDNLIYRAAKLMMERYNITMGIDVYVDKKIPIAAGLAGGSADAAATLRGMNRLFKLKIPNTELAEIGEVLGSDVPYCVYNQLCIARGKGEQLFFLKHKLKQTILLVTPPIYVSTKSVFESVDMAAIESKKITTMTNAIYNRNIPLMINALYNALEPFTFKRYPLVEETKRSILSYQPTGVIMSGSGPTFVVFGSNVKHLQEMMNALPSDHQVTLTKIH